MPPPNKTQPTTASVEDFLNAVPNAQKRADAFVLLGLMQQITRLAPKMWGPTIVGFGDLHYVYASGREGDSGLIGFSPRKANLTLYTVQGWERYPALLANLGQFSLGKVCLYIKRLSDVDMPALKQLIRVAYKDAKQSGMQDIHDR